MDKRALFEALRYRPHPGQVLVHRSKAPRRVLACGVRWGKSTCAVYECIAALLAPCDESLGWICAPTYDLSERIFRQVVSIVQRRFPDRVREFTEREHRLVVVNFGGGVSELRGKSADNPDSLLGEGIDYLVIDEAARMKAEIWEQHLSQRLIDKRGWALLLSTPRGWDWFALLHRRGQRGRDPLFESWNSPSWTNPLLSQEAIEAERARLPAAVFDEQFGARFIGLDPTPCDVCHGPSPTAPRITILAQGARVGRCPECGLHVGDDGRTLCHRGPKGEPMFFAITIEDRRSGEPPRREVCVPGAVGGERPREVSGSEAG